MCRHGFSMDNYFNNPTRLMWSFWFARGESSRAPLLRGSMRYYFPILCTVVLATAFPAALRANPVSSDAVLVDARFAALDADGNGRVTWEEFHNTNESISRQGFDIIDTNKNGELSLEEWRAFSSNHGMGIPMPPSRVTLPAGPLDPPVAPKPGEPSLPLIMPPAAPDGPTGTAVEAASPPSPDTPARVKEPSVPLLMPPAESAGPTPPKLLSPDEPSPPAVPPVTPPAPLSPARGSSEVHSS